MEGRGRERRRTRIKRSRSSSTVIKAGDSVDLGLKRRLDRKENKGRFKKKKPSSSSSTSITKKKKTQLVARLLHFTVCVCHFALSTAVLSLYIYTATTGYKGVYWK